MKIINDRGFLLIANDKHKWFFIVQVFFIVHSKIGDHENVKG
jgi:hypothetical protein